MTSIEQQPMEPGAGNLGLTRRSYDRLYYNGRRVVRDVEYLIHRQVPWASQRIEEGDAERVVGRFLLTQEQLVETCHRSSILRGNIEVAVPVGMHDGSPIIMAMWALNRHNRRPLVSVDHMCHETDRLDGFHPDPLRRVESLRQQGFRFVRNPGRLSLDRIYDLWGPIFGWSQSDIEGLPRRFYAQEQLHATERSVWFSAIVHGDDLVALSTAERLNLPLRRGVSVPIVESTEWCVDPRWEGRGLAAGCVSYLHAQIFSDLEMLDCPPVIIAETNFMSRADRVGYSSGMRIPPRWIEGIFVPQILCQNVSVGDGLSEAPLRDFTMMYIPPEHVRLMYAPELCRQIRMEGI